MKQDLSFWAGRRVFITGHTGFKGAWLSWVLDLAGAKVCGYALDPLPGSIFESSGLGQRLAGDIRSDICDREALTAEMKRFSPEIVFHLAAQALVLDSYEDPWTTYQSNVMGTLSALEAAKACGAKAFCAITSDKCYKNKEWVWGYRETDELGGHDPYSSSKACCEILTDSWRNSFAAECGMQIATARAGNVVGGGDRCGNRLLPDICKALAAGKAPTLRNPHAHRPWQHVLDALGGYLRLGESLLRGEPHSTSAFNFGPKSSDVVSVEEACRWAMTAWTGTVPAIDRAPPPRKEATLLSLDSSKARALLNYEGAWTARTAIEMTVEWEKFAVGAQNSQPITLEQIQKRFTFGADQK